MKIEPIALWHDGEFAVLFRNTAKGQTLLAVASVLERESRQNLLRSMTATARAATDIVAFNEGSEGLLVLPLRHISAAVAEFPVEQLIAFPCNAGEGLIDPSVPPVPPEQAVLVAAAIAAEAGRSPE